MPIFAVFIDFRTCQGSLTSIYPSNLNPYLNPIAVWNQHDISKSCINSSIIPGPAGDAHVYLLVTASTVAERFLSSPGLSEYPFGHPVTNSKTNI